MSDNVVSLHGGEIENERRKGFMQSVGESFDLYVKAQGHEPDAIVYLMLGIGQPSRIAWDIQGQSHEHGGVGDILSRAAVHAMAEAQDGYEKIE